MARRDDSVSHCTLKRANQNRCWTDQTQVCMLSCRGILRQAAHFLRVLFSVRSAIF